MNLTLQSENEKDLRKMSHEITKIVFLFYFFTYTMSIDTQVKLFLEQRILTGLVNASKLTQNDQSARN